MKEIRIAELRAEAPAGTESLVLAGRPIVYDQPTTINDPAGKFIEIIERGALDGADLSDVRLMYGHDTSRVPLARTPKTMQLSVSPAGLDMEATLPDTEGAREVHTAVKRGDLSGMSFAFKVPPGGDRYDRATNTRTIHKIAKVLECSVVVFPAYATASVEARAAMQPLNDERRRALLAANKILMKEF
jgi:HK97 family phage prohead protease